MTLIFVDDDTLIADSLRIYIGMDADINVLGTASNGRDAISLCEKEVPDVILMDVRMPTLNGVEATKVIKKRWPVVHIVMLTTFNEEELIKEALSSGAEGYLLKSTPADGIVERIKAIGKGAVVIDTKAFDNLYMTNSNISLNIKLKETLTQREMNIMYLVAQGHSNKEIAQSEHLSEGTVRNTISAILGKLELRDRTQLAVYYWKTKKE
jgi:NarL family two-component system response regulator LiaR